VDLPARLTSTGVIAISRGLAQEQVQPVAEALARAGVGGLEVTLNSPGALRTIEVLRKEWEPDVLAIGAGTVMTQQQGAAAQDAGAGYVISPHLDEDLVAWARSAGLPMLPGALTPSEIVRAWSAGATAVKVFPASAMGDSFVRELRGPLGHIPLVPTGGVDDVRAGRLIRDGAVAVAAGGWLIGDGTPDIVQVRGRALVTAVALARSTA
jgi:2-dehydro-3-deoxyphosphogluconate aldolase/(4S)-4-hydroxy-2-oxoglutarate aldolase